MNVKPFISGDYARLSSHIHDLLVDDVLTVSRVPGFMHNLAGMKVVILDSRKP